MFTFRPYCVTFNAFIDNYIITRTVSYFPIINKETIAQCIRFRLKFTSVKKGKQQKELNLAATETGKCTSCGPKRIFYMMVEWMEDCDLLVCVCVCLCPAGFGASTVGRIIARTWPGRPAWVVSIVIEIAGTELFGCPRLLTCRPLSPVLLLSPEMPQKNHDCCVQLGLSRVFWPHKGVG